MTAKPNLTLVTKPRPLPADHVERNPGTSLDLDVVRAIRVNRSAVERLGRRVARRLVQYAGRSLGTPTAMDVGEGPGAPKVVSH